MELQTYPFEQDLSLLKKIIFETNFRSRKTKHKCERGNLSKMKRGFKSAKLPTRIHLSLSLFVRDETISVSRFSSPFSSPSAAAITLRYHCHPGAHRGSKFTKSSLALKITKNLELPSLFSPFSRRLLPLFENLNHVYIYIYR